MGSEHAKNLTDPDTNRHNRQHRQRLPHEPVWLAPLLALLGPVTLRNKAVPVVPGVVVCVAGSRWSSSS